jgi:Transposase zinc-binding domain
MTELCTRPSLEVGDLLRAHGEAYRAQHPVTPEQVQVMRRLAACRTASLGGHVDACSSCGFTRISYNSCRDRHCPKCQAGGVPKDTHLPNNHSASLPTFIDAIEELVRLGLRKGLWMKEDGKKLRQAEYWENLVFSKPDQK